MEKNENLSYKVTVAEQPARHLAGLSKRLNMRDSHNECPILWEKFMPRMKDLDSIAEEGSFGASVNMDEKGNYDYWATVAIPQDSIVPSGMDCLDVKGGKYAQLVVTDLANVSEAYQYIYTEWEKAQNDYRIDYTVACLEYYQKDWRDGDPVTIFVPLQ